MIVRIEQHFVSFLPIRAQDKRPTVCQLEVRYLELHPLAADDRPVFAPIKLERFARRKYQLGIPGPRDMRSQCPVTSGSVDTRPGIAGWALAWAHRLVVVNSVRV
jgi:hypothetical protein